MAHRAGGRKGIVKYIAPPVYSYYIDRISLMAPKQHNMTQNKVYLKYDKSEHELNNKITNRVHTQKQKSHLVPRYCFSV